MATSHLLVRCPCGSTEIRTESWVVAVPKVGKEVLIRCRKCQSTAPGVYVDPMTALVYECKKELEQ